MKKQDLERKVINVGFTLKDVQEDDKYFHFSGYASTFGNIDRHDDIVAKGSFIDSINTMIKNGDYLPVLWQHKQHMPLGIYIEIREDDNGLFVRGRMPKEDAFVNGRVIPQMKVGSVKKMSIGFCIKDYEYKDMDEKRIRIIKKVDLWEVSLVTIPANGKADIVDMKAVIPYQNLPLAEKDTSWDPESAIKRVRQFLNISDKPNDEYKNAFLWHDVENQDNFTEYKLPIADVIDNKLVAIPRAIFAVAETFQDTSGGVDIPENEKEGIINNIEKYYKKMEIESPFNKNKKEIKGFENIKDISNYLKGKGLSKNETEMTIASLKKFIKTDQGKLDTDNQGKLDEEKEIDASNYYLKKLEELLKIIGG